MRLEYRPGTLLLHVPASDSKWTTQESARVDVVIACMGLSPQMEGEEGDAIESPLNGDREDIALPAVQADYLRQIKENGARIVLVLTGGSAIALGDVADLADAILFVWYPGQEGGHAVADVLFGDQSPSGKLPVTFPASLDQLPPFEDYAMAGRTYRYATAEPQFPFGFGLSYARFEYDGINLSASSIGAGDSLSAAVTLTDRGAVAADEVVQLYLSQLKPAAGDPLQTLVGFQRVSMGPGDSTVVTFDLTADLLTSVDEAGRAAVRPGAYRLTAGGCSPGVHGPALGAPTAVVAEFSIDK